MLKKTRLRDRESAEFFLPDGKSISFTLLRSRRKKTSTLQIRKGEVQLLAPRHMSKRAAIEIVGNKKDWILKKLEEWENKPKPNNKHFSSGTLWPFLGNNLMLLVQNGGIRQAPKRNRGSIVVPLPLEKHDSLENVSNRVSNKKNSSFVAENLSPNLSSSLSPLDKDSQKIVGRKLEKWYRLQAKDYFSSRTTQLAKKFSLSPSGIAVRRFRSRWGSCSTGGNIVYNWLLIMAPPNIVDYVIVHELCHLLVHNHSPLFWKEVEQRMPNYKKEKAWLSQNENLISFPRLNDL